MRWTTSDIYILFTRLALRDLNYLTVGKLVPQITATPSRSAL